MAVSGSAAGLAPLALLALLSLSACERPTAEVPLAGQPIVFVQSPRSAAAAPDSLAFREPAVSGSQVVVWNASLPAEAPRILSAGFEAAGAPAVNSPGTRVLFAGREQPDQTWRIYEVSIHGGRPQAISPEGSNATSATYLPDGRVVFASDLEQTRDPMDGLPAYSLYTSQTDGSERTRITFNLASDIEPTVLDDGRILYAAWQPPGIGRRDGAFALLTVATDGTGVSAFCGSHDRLGDKRRPRQVGGEVVFAAGDGERALHTVRLSRPLHSEASLAQDADLSLRSATAYEQDHLLVSLRPTLADGKQPSSFGLYVLDRSGTLEPRLLLDDPERDELDAVAARPGPRPKGRLSLVDPQAETGELLCLDARLTDQHASDDHRKPVSVRIYRGTPIPTNGSIEESRTPLDLPTTLLGTLSLHEDGSFLIEAPADTALRFETLDEEGRVLLNSKGWVWVRPNERRACIGCHEDREQAPRNRAPAALRIPESANAALAEGGRAVK